MSDILVRRLQAHEWPAYRELRLRSLADAPTAFGSSLAAEEAWRLELWMARLTAAAMSGRDCPLVAEQRTAMDGPLSALLWAKCDPEDAGIVNIFQMWVAPELRGRGVAASLLGEAIAWARAIGARTVQLGVVQGNASAVQLYRRAGFREVGTPEPIRPSSNLLEQTMHLHLDEQTA